MWTQFPKSRSIQGSTPLFKRGNTESQRLSFSVPQDLEVCNFDLILYSCLYLHCLNYLSPRVRGLCPIPWICPCDLPERIVKAMLCWFHLSPKPPCVFPLSQSVLFCHSHDNILSIVCWRLRHEGQSHVTPVALADVTWNQPTDNSPPEVWMGPSQPSPNKFYCFMAEFGDVLLCSMTTAIYSLYSCLLLDFLFSGLRSLVPYSDFCWWANLMASFTLKFLFLNFALPSFSLSFPTPTNFSSEFIFCCFSIVF